MVVRCHSAAEDRASGHGVQCGGRARSDPAVSSQRCANTSCSLDQRERHRGI